MDALSEILSGVKLHGALYFNAEFTAPWGVAAPRSPEMAPLLAPGTGHLLIYHFVLQGRAFARLENHVEPIEAGEVVIFPHGDAHVLGSEPTPRETPVSGEVERKLRTRELSLLRGGGPGPATRFVCGFMACDPHLSRPVLSGLPAMLKVNIRAGRAGFWLENSILHLVEQAAAGAPGSQALLAKLSEALFVETLRQHVSGLPEAQTGWLAAARDETVGRSLALLHRRVQHPWTLAELAEAVGVSRSVLGERFTRYLAEPPMSYLTRWRLQLAAQALRGTAKGVAEIAGDVGYESEAAFSRAFKREFGTPPARYRKDAQGGAGAV